MVPRFHWSEGTRYVCQSGESTTSRASFAPHRKQRKRRLAAARVPALHWRAAIGPDIALLIAFGDAVYQFRRVNAECSCKVDQLNHVQPPFAKLHAGNELLVQPKSARELLLSHAHFSTLRRKARD